MSALVCACFMACSLGPGLGDLRFHFGGCADQIGRSGGKTGQIKERMRGKKEPPVIFHFGQKVSDDNGRWAASCREIESHLSALLDPSLSASTDFDSCSSHDIAVPGLDYFKSLFRCK